MNAHGPAVSVVRRLSLDEFDECSRIIEMILKDLFDPENDQKFVLYELGRLGPDCHHFFEGYCDHIVNLTGGDRGVTKSRLWLYDKDKMERATAHEWAAFAVRDYYEKIFPHTPLSSPWLKLRLRIGITTSVAKNHLRTLIDRQFDTFLGIIWDMNRHRVAKSAYRVAARMNRERALVLANPPEWAQPPGDIKATLEPSASTQPPETESSDGPAKGKDSAPPQNKKSSRPIGLKFWAVGQYERGWKLFQFTTRVKTHDNPKGKWIERGDVEIPKGASHNLAVAFVKGCGGLSPAEAKKAVGGVHPKDAKTRLCKAIRNAISRANSDWKPNAQVPLPIKYDGNGKSYQCVVQIGHAIQDDDRRRVFITEEQRREELEGNLIRGE